MTAAEKIDPPAGPLPPKHAGLARIGIEALAGLEDRRARLREVLQILGEAGDEGGARLAARLSAQLDGFEPSVTMIGQVKAGKTSLVNAMIGMPELLPSDVNPWTSVVTSLHLSTSGLAHDTRASFRFFGEEEWQRLFSRGGRLGELASRAGADDEVEKVHRQLEELRDKSRRRLGRRFEMLLDQQHDYGYFDRKLIERYVVLGDDFESDADAGRQTGRFADITRSADLYFDRPDLPVGMCIRDTPGVNDTFMIREQITIRAIRDSRLCVVVLSAHQALSSVDLALVRLISNVKSREVVIFVNRIDELSDPRAQVPEIEASIRATLTRHQGPADCQLIFGSAYWANRALTGELKGMTGASADSLVNWAQAAGRAAARGTGAEVMVWELSGIPALMRALAERIVEGEGREMLDRTAAQARNLLRAIAAAGPGTGGAEPAMTPAQIGLALDRLAAGALDGLGNAFAAVGAEFDRRLDRAHRAFLDRATTALIAHLERDGESRVWEYDPSGLRMLLRTAWQVYAANAHRRMQSCLEGLAESAAALWRDAFRGLPEDFRIEAAAAPRVPPPVQIGQTIALDLKGSWWRRWWQRRRGYQTYAADFWRMIEAETRPMVDDLAREMTQRVAADAAATLRDFVAGQRELMLDAAGQVADGYSREERSRRAEALRRAGRLLEGEAT